MKLVEHDRGPGRPATRRLGYVLPAHFGADSSHFAHVPRFLTELGRHCQLDVIVERSDGPVSIANATTYAQRHAGNRLLRMVELALIVRRLRKDGCRRFFVRISVGAALTLGLLRRPLAIEVFYWNSGQGRNVLPLWTKPLARFRAELASVPLRLVLRLVDRLVTGPERMAAYYAAEYGVPLRKISIVYNDVDPAPFRIARGNDRDALLRSFGIPPDIPVMLFVGRLSPLKGGHNLLNLCRTLAARGVQLKCLAVGAVHLSDVEMNRANEDDDGMLRLVGEVPNHDLPPLYAAATVFVLPSESEGFPRVLLEAMAAGLPVVATDVGGVRDILGDRQQAYVCPRGDIACMADRITELLASPDVRDQLSSENEARVERFTTPSVVQMFLDRVVDARL